MKNINSLFRSEDITIVNADDYLQEWDIFDRTGDEKIG